MIADNANHSGEMSSVNLIRAGLKDLEKARQELSQLAEKGMEPSGCKALLEALTHACEPDKALELFVHLIQYGAGLTTSVETQFESEHDLISSDLSWLANNQRSLTQLISVLGASQAMGVLMQNRPKLVEAVTTHTPTSNVFTDNRESSIEFVIQNCLSDPNYEYARAVNILRATYYQRLAVIMVDDLSSVNPQADQPHISRLLSQLADDALRAALLIAQRQTPESERCRFALIGMGKLGAQELNYVSDVDVIYIVEPKNTSNEIDSQQLIQVGSKIAMTLQQICQSVIPGVSEPSLWKVDTSLRPEGKNGPLVRTMTSYKEYYDSWAENWEFQALLKARPLAGDSKIGLEFQQMCDNLVWSAAQRPNFVYDCQQMRNRVESLIPAKLRDREIKLGQGGLRDVEFAVQMLQLVHGRTDMTLHTRSTLEALQALAAGGFISSQHAERLAADYRFERVLEHRQQMWLLKRTHLFPDLGSHNRGGLESRRKITLGDLDGNDDIYRLSRAFHCHPDELVQRYDQARREIRALHLAIFFRPMLPFEAQLDDDEVSLEPQAAMERFASIGFADPEAAFHHVQALTRGLTRSAKINRILLPAVIAWLGNGQDPDMGLLEWRTLEERFGNKSDYLGFLRDSTSAAKRLCHVLSNSRYLSSALCKSVESVTWLGNDDLLRPRTIESLTVSCDSYRQRHADNSADFANALRSMRRREIERIGLGWMSHVCNESTCLSGMSDTYDAMIQAALLWSQDKQMRERSLLNKPANITVIALGRYGGREVNFSSDADAMIIYECNDGFDDYEAASFAQSVCDTMRSILSSMTLSVEPKVDMDLNLRPEGRSGPMVRSIQSCRLYYRQWSNVWEHQALLRARYAAGDSDLCQRFLHEIADPLRYPEQSIQPEQVSEIRKLKARMEAERLPRGVRRDRHLKLGAGGLSDVEWTIQLLQLQFAGRYPELRLTSTIDTLHALQSLDLIDADDAQALEIGWKLCTSARNARYLWSGKASQADILPDDTYILGAMAVYRGYPAHRGADFANEILGAMRHCRDVMSRLFYGE